MSKIDSITSIAKLFLPELVVEHFDLIKHELRTDSHHFYYTEKNLPPTNKSQKLHSKGFYEQSIVQDFPIRGKSVYLYIKRRKWTDLDSGKTIKRDWILVAKGTRMTSEFASFLKELNM